MQCSKLKDMVQVPAYSLNVFVVYVKLHNVAFQKTAILIFIVMKNSNLKELFLLEKMIRQNSLYLALS